MKKLVYIGIGGMLLSAAVVLIRIHPIPVKAQAACGVGSLQGTYAFHLQGWNVDDQFRAQTPFAEIGSAVADGSGNMKVEVTLSQGGEIVKLAFDLTYQVNPDCSGSFTPAPGSQGGPAEFVLGDGGKQMMLISTQPGLVLSGTAVRQ